MKKIYLIIILLFVISMILAQPNNSTTVQFNTIASNLNETTIQFNLTNYTMEKVTKNGIEYSKILYENTGDLLEIGKPELPLFSSFVAIPDEGGVDIQIISSDFETINNINIYPRQNLNMESTPESKAFTIDDNFYSKNIEFPQNITQINDPVLMRDYRVVPVSFMPFQYNPAKKRLKIYKNITVKITSNPSKVSINPKTSHKKKSRFFEKLYQTSIVNYNEIKDRDENYQQPTLLIIYHDNSNLASMVNMLADWKHQKGFDVHVANTGETGTSFTSIKNYIQNAYDTWENPPEYVMLVGDANSGDSYYIGTTSFDGGAGDIGYVFLEGNDILADAFIGRLSVSALSEMQTVVSKIMKYERTPYMDETEWYNKAVLVGDPSNSGQSTIYTNLFIKQVISDVNNDFNFIEAYSGGYTSTMSSATNSGVSYFNYRGWYGMSGWDNSDTYALHNGFKLPMVVAITCGTGDFNEGYEDSINEVFLTAGTASNPKGGIAAISTATIHTHTCFNNIVDAGIYQAIFKEDIYQPGAALIRAKYALYLSYPQNPSSHVTQFTYWNNLMGDPSIDLWTDKPENFNIEFDDNIAIGTKYINTVCTDNEGNPLSGVWVTALKGNDEIFATGFTDENGEILLDINAMSAGDINLTATKHNFIPQRNTITVNSEDTNIVLQNIVIDDSAGNNDGNVNPNENIGFEVQLKNYGTADASDVTATISTQSDLVDITINSASYPNIAPNQTVSPTQNFDVHFHSDIIDGTEVVFQIDITSGAYTKTDYFAIEVKSANLVYQNYSLPGNSNGVFDPLETSNITISVKNFGTMEAQGVSGELASLSSKIEVTNANATFGNISPNQTINNNSNPFEISGDSHLVPGMMIPMQLTLSNADGFNQIVNFNIQIGNPQITDPLGPDEFGHFIYDNEDITYLETASYDWVEIDPANGGNGTAINLSDSGNRSDVEVIDLPISFVFYGKTYNQLTVCSDGWVSPGNHSQPAFMNWPIPGPLAPQPLIAPFWDDLKKVSGSKILYYYNAADNSFIVEWNNMKNDASSSVEETFEVILYDVGIYPTTTGDSKIKFQYKTINNIDAGSYGGGEVQHGQYATVGIQDENGEIGLEYSFNNQYPTAAKHLEDNMALIISGAPMSFEEAFIVLGDVDINDSGNDGQADFGDSVDMTLHLNNVGSQTATGVSATISIDDPYITLHNATSDYSDIAGESTQGSITPFTFDVAGNVPDGHIASFAVNIQSNQNSWSYNLNLEMHAPDIQYSSYAVANDDSNDGLLNPGESADIIFNFENVGGSAETNLHFTLASDDTNITFNNDTFDISHIYGNSTFAIVNNVNISSSCSAQYSIPIQIYVIGSNGYFNTTSTSIFVGATMEGFETGDFSAFNWEFPDGEWLIDSSNFHEGSYSAKSRDIGDLQQTTMKIQVTLSSPDNVSFYRKVSCEDNGNNGYDRLMFYIDNTEKGRWGGERSWHQYSYQVPAGTHWLKWIYYKDTMVSSGQDCAWVDDIVLPGAAGSVPDPLIMLNYTSFDETITQNSTKIDTLDITNIGGGILGYYVSIQNASTDFISLSSTAGNLNTGQTDHILITFDSTNLAFGEYAANIVVDDNRGQTVIPVHMLVQGVGNDENQLPTANKLFAAYPNPFNLSSANAKGGAVIKFALKKSSDVIIDVYNLRGQKVKTVTNSNFKAGTYSSVWNGKDEKGKHVSSGLYFYRIKANEFEKIRKMIVIK